MVLHASQLPGRLHVRGASSGISMIGPESNADHDVLCFAGDAAGEGNDAVGDRCELYATCLPPTAG